MPDDLNGIQANKMKHAAIKYWEIDANIITLVFCDKNVNLSLIGPDAIFTINENTNGIAAAIPAVLTFKFKTLKR